MAHVTVHWDLGQHDFSFGTTPDHFEVSLGGGVADMAVAVDQTNAVFPAVPEGDYTASVQLVGSDGAMLGDPATSSSFHVNPDTVSLAVAVNVSGSQTP